MDNPLPWRVTLPWYSNFKKLIWLAAFLAVCSCGGKQVEPDPPTPDPTPSVVETPSFAKGADISWAS